MEVTGEVMATIDINPMLLLDACGGNFSSPLDILQPFI
jgi:hypothetical protein